MTRTFSHDALERLVAVREGGVLVARYGYDVQGRRIATRVYSAGTGGTVGYLRFVYEGAQVAAETDSAGTLGVRYLWGLGTDRLVSVTGADGTPYAVATDELGSVRTLGTLGGSWVGSRRYGPYGAVRGTAGSWPAWLRLGWTGREWDAETQLSYHRARYYDPAQRRWTQEDPLGYAGGRNLYAYVDGQVAQATDPFGETLCEVGQVKDCDAYRLPDVYSWSAGVDLEFRVMQALMSLTWGFGPRAGAPDWLRAGPATGGASGGVFGGSEAPSPGRQLARAAAACRTEIGLAAFNLALGWAGGRMVSGAIRRFRTLEQWGTSSRYDALLPSSQDRFLSEWAQARATVRDARFVDRVILPAHGAIATAMVKPTLSAGDLIGIAAGFFPGVGLVVDGLDVAMCLRRNL